MASSTHTVSRFCACAVQTKHYTALFRPGGLNKYLPARMAKLYEVPISFIASLYSFRTMSPRLTEDRGAASSSLVARTVIVAETETDASDDYVFVYGMFYEVVYRKVRVPRFWVLLEQCIPCTRPLLIRRWPLPSTCLPARCGLDTRPNWCIYY